MKCVGNLKFYLHFNSESKLSTLVQKLHDFLAHSSEESEDANSPPAFAKKKTTGKNSEPENSPT
ncbi:PREDICTED: transcriptional regulator ATRX-like, partial [Tinamus guttatus]|uniref:transcriptional regulator ATRX-like n=1 Tax=Tinamus guttatus TaxID=94827 RepID=UPI00052F001F